MLSKRELESRYEVFAEQYVTNLNIEAETAASLARTMLLPAAARHLALLREAALGELVSETEGLIDEFITAIKALESANLEEHQPHGDVLEHGKYMRDEVIPAMAAVRGSPTSSSGSWPTTCGRCRSTRRSSSSSSDRAYAQRCGDACGGRQRCLLP